MQYRAYLETTYEEVTPTLRNITLVYNYWPNTTLVSPKNGYITNNNDPILTWNFTYRDSMEQTAFQIIIDEDQIYSSIDHESTIINSSENSSQFSDAYFINKMPDGTWYWKVRTKDNDGEWGLYSEPFKIIIDTISPRSKIKSLKNNNYCNKIEHIFGSANDSLNGTGLDCVELSIHRMDDDTYFNGLSWVGSETWLPVSRTNNWTYNSSVITWFSGWEYNIRSRTMDIALNIETPGSGKTFIYDPDPVTYSKPFPSASKIHNTTKVEVGITVSDELSGVNASTIEYSVSNENGTTFDPWTSVLGYEKGKIINLKLNLTFPNGTGNRIRWRAADLAGNGPTESEVYPININTWVPNVTYRPEVRLWSPPNGTSIESSSVNLSWILVNSDLKNVKYDVFLDTENPPIDNIWLNLSDTFLLIDNLENGNTYYWTVIPKVGELTGTCQSGIWSFIVDIPLPKVTLVSPTNNSIITSINPTLVWTVEYTGTEKLKYHIHLNSEPDLVGWDEVTTEYYSPQGGLWDNFTYYWQVVPFAGGLPGEKSEVWSFTVKKIDQEIPEFGVDMTLEPDYIEIKPGEVLFAKAIVTNLGELTDNFTVITDTALDSKLNAEVYKNRTLELGPKESKIFIIMLSVQDGSELGVENISITAQSELDAKYGLNVEEREQLVVRIFKPDKKSDHGAEARYIYYSILIIVILIIVIILILLLAGRRKKTEQYRNGDRYGTALSEPSNLDHEKNLNGGSSIESIKYKPNEQYSIPITGSSTNSSEQEQENIEE